MNTVLWHDLIFNKYKCPIQRQNKHLLKCTGAGRSIAENLSKSHDVARRSVRQLANNVDRLGALGANKKIN